MKFSKIGPKSKIEFVWIFFQKTKCTNSGDKNPEGQVCNPKNIPTVEVYFSNFPNGTPCSKQASKKAAQYLSTQLELQKKLGWDMKLI